MFNRKLNKAAFIALPFLLVAVTSGGKSVGEQNILTNAAGDTTHHDSTDLDTHAFDKAGLCTCIPFTETTELTNAPRIQINKNVAPFVKKYNQTNGFFLDKAAKKVQSYFSILDSMLKQEGMPVELKYLAFIESGLKPITVSRSGAKGPWAFMPVAAKEYGLKISKHKDERLDYYRSTEAAARLLADLYEKYEDWLLVIAAYNSGPGWIQKAIKRSGSKNYWALQNFLPVETRSHVKRFIAVHYHFEGHGSLTTLTKSETKAHISAVAKFIEKKKEVVPDSVIIEAVNGYR